MELNYLRPFFEVAKAGSFTEAARKLHISQSALSKSVALLEDLEGVKLFDRSKKGVTLTEIGLAVFLKCETLFKTITEIEMTCKGTQRTCEGLLSFGASDHIANYFLVPTAKRMRSEFPKTVPSIFSGTPNDIIDLILRNEIEFGLFFTKINIPAILYSPLLTLDMAVVCHPDLLKIPQKHLQKPSKTDDTLKQTLRRVFSENGFIGSIKAQYQTHPSRELLTLLGDDPNIAFETNSQEMQKRLCLAGAGVAYLARFMVEKEISDGRLSEIRLKKPLQLQMVLARRRGRELSLNARTFLDMLKSDSC